MYNPIYCAERLIGKGAQFNITHDDGKQLWFLGASHGSIVILRYLVNLGFDKNCFDLMGRNALYNVVCLGDITVSRFLLEAGVKVTRTVEGKANQPTHMPSVEYLDSQMFTDSCLEAISKDMVEMVKLLIEYDDSQTFESIDALKFAMRKNSLKILKYLLSKYIYPLNREYKTTEGAWETVLTEACKGNQLGMVLLFMKHGADPCKKSGQNMSFKNAITITIEKGFVKMLVSFIRDGVNFDCQLHHETLGSHQPFEFSVFVGNIYAVEMILRTGYSCGVFSLKARHSLKNNVDPAIADLMAELEVEKNDVNVLQILCRKAILNHLYPDAGRNISKLPLPPCLITFLNIPELDKLIEKYEHQRRYGSFAIRF